MKIMNLTPHTINLISGDKNVPIEPSGTIARVSVSRQQVATVDVDGVTFPINKNLFGEITDLPDSIDGTIFIVSAIVANACKERNDLVIVDEAVRNEAGQIIGAKALAKV